MADPFQTGAEVEFTGAVPEWRTTLLEEDPDDEQIETPADVVEILGFDPAEGSDDQ